MPEAQSQAMRMMMNAYLGKPMTEPEPEPKKVRLWWFPRKPHLPSRCNVSPVWPDGKGGWVTFQCTFDWGHKGVMHRDENYWVGYHNDDIAFFKRQYDLLFGETSENSE